MTATIGADVQRFCATEKMTGTTHFAADHAGPGLAHALLVTATIGKGRSTRIDTSKAERTPDVLLVLTHESMDRLAAPGYFFADRTGLKTATVIGASGSAGQLVPARFQAAKVAIRQQMEALHLGLALLGGAQLPAGAWAGVGRRGPRPWRAGCGSPVRRACWPLLRQRPSPRSAPQR
jgi:CO/xanthine dehydrogenase Mo-binding subunit